jgi:SAM-dependent methyltransferase
MVDYARRRAAAEGLANVSFLQADAQIHPFEPGSFDLVISRTGASFFGDPAAGFANIASALRSGGRLVLMTWQAMPANDWIREISRDLGAGRDLPAPPPDAPGPFSLADPDRVRAVLAPAGFTDIDFQAIEAPMWFGTDADDAQRFVLGLLGWMLEGIDDAGRARARDDLRSTLDDTPHPTASRSGRRRGRSPPRP